jgi:endonuclease/exonuclease/phosphatase family metal-dependent hydrolase
MKLFLLLSLLAFSISLTHAKSVSVMTYNLENIFDIKHDKDKSDWTWLPLSFKTSSKEVQSYCASMKNEFYKKNCFNLDWSQKVLNQKIKNLARVIRTYNHGKGADIIIFEEVENIQVLRQLVSKGLSKLGYKYISLIEGPDSRGIDIGMISRFPIKKQNYHTLELTPYSTRTTRGILEVEYKIGKKSLTVFGNHWPSQGNIDETRLLASELLKKLALKSKSDLVVATGDFNTLRDDQPHGLNLNILPIFEDVEIKARELFSIKAQGTHWYRGEWESIDKILVLKSSLLKGKASINYKKFEILYKPFMLTDVEWTDYNSGTIYTSKGTPNRFDPKSGEGYSDHLPVAVEFNL